MLTVGISKMHFVLTKPKLGWKTAATLQAINSVNDSNVYLLFRYICIL